MAGGLAIFGGAIAFASQGFRRPLTAFEALLCVVFPLGLVTGAIPYALARFDHDACVAAGANRQIWIWLAGAAITCVGATLTVAFFKPRLALNRMAGAPWLWLSTGAVLIVGNLATITGGPCRIEGSGALFALPAISNAIFGFYMGWYWGQRRPPVSG